MYPEDMKQLEQRIDEYEKNPCPNTAAEMLLTEKAVLGCVGNELYGPAIAMVSERVIALESSNARLREALAPFAKAADGIPRNWPALCPLRWEESETVKGHFYLKYYDAGQNAGPTISDFRKAQAALEGKP